MQPPVELEPRSRTVLKRLGKEAKAYIARMYALYACGTLPCGQLQPRHCYYRGTLYRAVPRKRLERGSSAVESSANDAYRHFPSVIATSCQLSRTTVCNPREATVSREFTA